MKSFRQFITEGIILHDNRKGNEPFLVRTNSGKYLMFDHHGDDYIPSTSVSMLDDPKRRAHHFGYSAGVIVDPVKQEVSLDVSDKAEFRNRRPNTTLGKFNHSASKATPILLHNDNDLSFTRLKGILKTVHKHVAGGIAHYKITGSEALRDQTVGDFIASDTPNESWAKGKGDITMYHGTSAKRAKDILKNGLKPGIRKESYSDLVAGYSDKNVYLADDPEAAANYATREALNDKSNAVVLKVKIKPEHHANLRNDEDRMHWFGPSVSEGAQHQFYTQHPELKEALPTEGGTHFRHHPNLSNGTTNFTREFLERVKPPHEDTDAYESRLAGNLLKAYATVNTLRDTVAYKGHIKPEHIEPHTEWSIKGAGVPRDPDRAQFVQSIRKMQGTLKRG